MNKYLEAYKYIEGLLNCDDESMRWPLTIRSMEAFKELTEKEEPKKPIYVDTRFRHRGLKIGEFTTLEKCYKCPNCNSHIFYDFDHYRCPHCGQKIDWRLK